MFGLGFTEILFVLIVFILLFGPDEVPKIAKSCSKFYRDVLNIKNIKTAVLWKKKDSTFEPDFCAQKLDGNPWIVQPFERYEEIRVEDLVKKHGS